MIERDFYGLSALAQRWGCTVTDLLHLGMQDRAQLCVNIYGMAEGQSRTRLETELPTDLEPEYLPQTQEAQREAAVQDAAFERWKARTTRNMPHGVYELRHDDLRYLDMPDAFPHELHEALKFDGGWWECVFDPPVAFSADHLCMLREEVVRLDREIFGKGAPSSKAQPAIAPLSPRAEGTYLTVIGGLLELMLAKTPNGRPQFAFDSQAAIIEELLLRHPGKPGIAKSTLEGKFAEARRRLNSM